MGIMAIRRKFPSNQRCDYCHKPSKALYQINLDGIPIFVCSGEHAETARKNWEEKKELGIKPGTPIDISKPIDEAEGDNLAEIE